MLKYIFELATCARLFNSSHEFYNLSENNYNTCFTPYKKYRMF